MLALSSRFFIFIVYQRGYCFRRRRSFNTFNMTNARRGIRSSIQPRPQPRVMIYRFGILLSRPAALEHLSLDKAQNPPALLRILRAPAPSIIAFFHRVKYLRCIAFDARIDPRTFLRGSLIFVTDHCVDPSSVARSSLVRQSMREKLRYR